MNKLKRVLISVSDKRSLDKIARIFHQLDIEIISSGGTRNYLEKINIPVTPIEKVTGNPEAFGGRMKTLSFQISSALLYRRGHSEDEKQAKNLNIKPIDMVICNLYPFKDVAKKEAELSELIENIDIGGPTMIRAAAKNYASVSVVTSPDQYDEIIHELEKNVSISLKTREALALSAFEYTASYEAAVAMTLQKTMGSMKRNFFLDANEKKELRYGENPHQKAFCYINEFKEGLASITPLQGKALSYNNLLDADAALRCTRDLTRVESSFKSAVSVIKHTNPCGQAKAHTPLRALEMAWNGDPMSSFGSIICFNQLVDYECAQWLQDKFVEVIIAPDFSAKALNLFKQKKNLRLLSLPVQYEQKEEYMIRSIDGGYLVQEEDVELEVEFQNVTQRKFPQEMKDLLQFGPLSCKHLKSNAIALVQKTDEGLFLVGAGMGNPNRFVSLEQAVLKAKENGITDFSQVYLISDAFFPFADSIELAHKHGIEYIIQPGGSIKDSEVIAACNKFNIAMSFTGKRHFRH